MNIQKKEGNNMWKSMAMETYRERGGLLIGINGVARSGKDTIGKLLCANHGFERLAFADALRLGLYEMNPIVTFELKTQKQGFWEWLSGEPERRELKIIRIQDLISSATNPEDWDRAKVDHPEVRRLLQSYGTEAGRMIHGEDCWASIIRDYIEANPNKNFVITDMRFENEIDLVDDLGGFKLQVQREGVTSVNNHVSDRVLPAELFHEVLMNNGTILDLEEKVNDLVIRINPFQNMAGTDTFARFV